MSSVTALIVLCSMRFWSAVGGAIDDGGVELHRFGAVVDDQPPDAVRESRDTPLTPSMLQGFAASSGPMNIS